MLHPLPHPALQARDVFGANRPQHMAAHLDHLAHPAELICATVQGHKQYAMPTALFLVDEGRYWGSIAESIGNAQAHWLACQKESVKFADKPDSVHSGCPLRDRH